MKIEFEGTFAEFIALFKGVILTDGKAVHALPPSFGENVPGVPSTPPVAPDLGAAGPPGPGDTKFVTADDATWNRIPADTGPGLRAELPNPEDKKRDPSGIYEEIELPALTQAERANGWSSFVEVCREWIEGFEQTMEVPAPDVVVRDEMGNPVDAEGNPLPRGSTDFLYVPDLDEEGNQRMQTVPAPQPDRLALMQAMGQGPYVRPIVIMALEFGSLQRMVEAALHEIGVSADDDKEWLDYCDRVAGTMVQVSREGFPELQGMYDYSTKWRRASA